LKNITIGAGESGKSTILKQMKIINQNGYSKNELRSWKIIVYRNLIESAQTLLRAMKNLDIPFENSANNVNNCDDTLNDEFVLSEF
jgi:guanine nucleotide-binding protein subunit alpha